MKTFRDQLNGQALRRLLSDKQLDELSHLVTQTSQLLFDAVAGEGAWQAEIDEDKRRVICERIMVRMVSELFKPEQSDNSRAATLH